MSNLFQRLRQIFSQLRWKLTFSMIGVVVGALLVVLVMVSYLILNVAFIPDNLDQPEIWLNAIKNKVAPVLGPLLLEDPINVSEIELVLWNLNTTINEFTLFQVGDVQFNIKTKALVYGALYNSKGQLIAYSQMLESKEHYGWEALYTASIPGLVEPLTAALIGERDVNKLSTTSESDFEMIVASPIIGYIPDENYAYKRSIVGAFVLIFESLPTEKDIPVHIQQLLGKSIAILIFAAGIMGAIFGFFTAKNFSKRFDQLASAAEDWSRGNLLVNIQDDTGDEFSHLAARLNQMAADLKDLMEKRQEIAVYEERNRLARELHDSAKQQAFAASFQIGSAIEHFESNPGEGKRHLLEAEKLVDSVRRELIDLIHELRPPAMSGRYLDETLNDYAIEWAHQNNIEVNFDSNGRKELPLEVKQSLYRILQEILSNTARHSQAKRVDIALEFDTNIVELSISDDGVGFDTNNSHTGMGLRSITERTVSLGGNLEIQSAPGAGTKIYVRFPITVAQEC